MEAEGHRPRAQGSSRSPLWRGGGIVFGPIPRDYRGDLPKKVRQLARRSAFNARAREGMVHVVDPFTMDAPKTSTLMALLGKLSLGETKTLILTAGSKPSVYLSGRNVPHVDVLPFTDATAYDILHADALVIESAALGRRLRWRSRRPDAGAEAEAAGSKPDGLAPEGRAKKRPREEAQEGRAKATKAAKPEGGEEGAGQEAGREEEGEQVMADLHHVLVRPLITEKSSAAWQDRKEYVFEVHPEATKGQIREALKQLFGVTVTSVRTMQMRRNAMIRGQARGVSARWKKAIVTLRPGRLARRLRELTMPIRQFRPITAGTRFRSVSGFDEITRGTPEKSLLEPIKRSGGRNNQGHITSRYIGGGHKRMYRKIDFKRNKFGIPAKVSEIEYDPNRNARIALLVYADGEKRYILHPAGLKQGDTVVSGPGSDVRTGNALPLGEDAARHDGAQHRAQDRQGRRHGALGRPGRAGRGARRRIRDAAPEVDGNAPDPQPLPRHRRRSRQRGARAAVDRQGRQEPLARPQPARARRRDEPGRSPARWW